MMADMGPQMRDIEVETNNVIRHHVLCNLQLSLVNPLRGCTCGLAERLQARIEKLAIKILKQRKVLMLVNERYRITLANGVNYPDSKDELALDALEQVLR